MNKTLIALSLFSAYSVASNWEQFNEVVWQADAVTVSKNSVIPVPEKCSDRARIELAETSRKDTINNGKVSLTINFSVNKSPDSKYWIIDVDSDIDCNGDGFTCISNTYTPETKAVVSCMRYKGMTIRLGENGEPVIESDIPEYQESLKRIKVEQ
ncbi:hypothetical protein G3489_19495 [Shewanella baltica]|uniref:hypothetical protein n=1 Tax=Shewanella baltica TaxID=62322 RepID=UPI00217E52BB|nr:hypothetical protein [Shewanella baltica]MCS6271862.1 hypothetical protein [Shewanella baltica]